MLRLHRPINIWIHSMSSSQGLGYIQLLHALQLPIFSALHMEILVACTPVPSSQADIILREARAGAFFVHSKKQRTKGQQVHVTCLVATGNARQASRSPKWVAAPCDAGLQSAT